MNHLGAKHINQALLNHFLGLVSIELSDQGPESSVPEREVERGQLPRDLEDSQIDNTKKSSSAPYGAPNEAFFKPAWSARRFKGSFTTYSCC